MINGSILEITDLDTLNALTDLMNQMRNGHRLSLVPEPMHYTIGEISIDEKTRSVTRDGDNVKLTPREFDLLIALARRRGAAVSKSVLMREVWNNIPRSDSRTLDAHVFELRRKLEDHPGVPKFLITVRKFGYRLSID
ncbi:MAG TPA: winged helix-turn-helix domain-containing protein [Gemmatimonadaceae bacterium]